MIRLLVFVPEAWVDPLVSLVLAVGGWADASDGCECVYLPLIKFVLEV